MRNQPFRKFSNINEDRSLEGDRYLREIENSHFIFVSLGGVRS